MEDKIIAFTVSAFVLSQISERISNLFKLYLPSDWFGNIRDKEDDPQKEKIRERKILVFSWIAGLITTGLFWGAAADAATDSLLYWMQAHKNNYFFFFGMSVFLSFGSKFWHDILDLVLEYKNAKRELNNLENAFIDRVEELEKRLEQRPGDIIKQALAQLKVSIKGKPGVVSVVRAFSTDGKPVIRVYFKDRHSAAQFENELIWTDEQETEHHIRVEKIVSGPATAQSGSIGGQIFNMTTPKRYGTLGYLFEDAFSKQPYLLSCYHVLRSTHPWQGFQLLNEEDIGTLSKGQVEPLATLEFGFRDTSLDVAIAKINAPDSIDRSSLLPITGSAEVTERYNGTPVFIKGLKSGTVNAMIYEPTVEEVTINYDDHSQQTFGDFFSLCLPDNMELKCPTQAGDSGAIVYRENGEALGIIVGGTSMLAYAMRITTIEQNLGIKIHQKV